MSEVYNDLLTGLQEVFDYTQGKPTKIRITSVSIDPLKTYSKDNIKQIRKNTGMSQSVFAETIGVSKKTIEAWEAGTSSPQGSSRRILELFEKHSDFAIRMGLVVCI